MSERKKETKKTRVQIQGGFIPPNVPLIKGATMSDHEKRRIDEGFVPQKAPSKPAKTGDKGFVPQPSPRKPPEKPDKGKK